MDRIGARSPTSTLPQPEILDSSAQPVCSVHVCTSCRQPGALRGSEESRPGFILYQLLREAFEASHLSGWVEVKRADCLSICPRPCGIALSLPGSWTYLFGDQKPEETVRDIVDCVSLYLKSPKGFMPRAKRPMSLRGSILGRVPPLPGTH
jgi:predicted metal-binding protein